MNMDTTEELTAAIESFQADFGRIVEQVRDVAQPDGQTRMEGRNMSVLLTPR